MEGRIFLEDLPKGLRELCEAIGLPATMRLVECHGGVPLLVPAHFRAEHDLVAQLGEDAARVLIERYAGRQVYVAKADAALQKARDMEIARRLLAGETYAAVARAFRLSIRQVFTIAKKPGTLRDPRQMDLF